MKTNEKRNSPPVYVARSGSVCANVWEQNHDKGSHYKVTLACFYKNECNQWQRGRTFFTDELPRVAEVIAKAEQWIRRQQRSAELPADCPAPA